jgi:hypothetical protein
MEKRPNQEQQVQENEFLKINLKNRELLESKTLFFNMARRCIGWITFFIIVVTIFMCLFSTHYTTTVRGVKAEIVDYRKSDHDNHRNEKNPASVGIYLKNTNHFKVTVDFFITYRNSKVSKQITIILEPFEEKQSWGNDLVLYKGLNLGDDVSKDDLEINMTSTCNSHSYFGFPSK